MAWIETFAGQELGKQSKIKEDKMKPINHMRGATLITILVMALLVIFACVIVIRLVPPYLSNYGVQDALKELAATPDADHFSVPKLKDSLSRKLQASYVKGVTADNLEIIKVDKQVTLKMKYESRVHLLGNIDAVLMFDNEEVVGGK